MFAIAIIVFIFASVIYLAIANTNDVVINHAEAYKAYLEDAQAAYDNEDAIWIEISVNEDGENMANKPWDYYVGRPENSDNGPIHTHLERVTKVAWYENKKRAKVYCLRYLMPGQKPTAKKYNRKSTRLYDNIIPA